MFALESVGLGMHQCKYTHQLLLDDQGNTNGRAMIFLIWRAGVGQPAFVLRRIGDHYSLAMANNPPSHTMIQHLAQLHGGVVVKTPLFHNGRGDHFAVFVQHNHTAR